MSLSLMAIKPSAHTSFDGEISLLDIIQFFKANIKRISFFVIMGGILGSLYGGFSEKKYEGSVLISPAKVAGVSVVNPKVILTELDMNSYFSKETFLACNPTLDKDIDYKMSDIVTTSLSKDGDLVKLKMSHSNKETIHACLDNIINNIKTNQKNIANPLIDVKKYELNLTETKLKLAERFREQLNQGQIKTLKREEQRYPTDLFYANIVLNNTYEINMLLDKIVLVRMQLSSDQTKDASQTLPINIQREVFPSLKLGLLLGLFLGSVLGFFNTIMNLNSTVRKAR